MTCKDRLADLQGQAPNPMTTSGWGWFAQPGLKPLSTTVGTVRGNTARKRPIWRGPAASLQGSGIWICLQGTPARRGWR